MCVLFARVALETPCWLYNVIVFDKSLGLGIDIATKNQTENQLKSLAGIEIHFTNHTSRVK